MVKRGAQSISLTASIRKPTTYDLGQQFEVVTVIRRADINPDEGWVVPELEGKGEDIEGWIPWVTCQRGKG